MVGMNALGAGVEKLIHSLLSQKREPVTLVLWLSFVLGTLNKEGNTPSSKYPHSWLYGAGKTVSVMQTEETAKEGEGEVAPMNSSSIKEKVLWGN